MSAPRYKNPDAVGDDSAVTVAIEDQVATDEIVAMDDEVAA